MGKTFWRQNWKLYKCKMSGDQPSGSDLRASKDTITAAQRHWHAELDDLQKSFDQTAQHVDPDLYTPIATRCSQESLCVCFAVCQS